LQGLREERRGDAIVVIQDQVVAFKGQKTKCFPTKYFKGRLREATYK